MKKPYSTFWFIALAIGVVFLLHLGFFSDAHAASDFEAGGKICPKYQEGLTSRVVWCIQSIVVASVENVLRDFLAVYKAAVLACLVLSITLYGVMFLNGSVRNLNGETFFLIIKFGVVCLLSFEIVTYIPNIFGIMEHLQTIVSSYLDTANPTKCADSAYLASLFPSHEGEGWSVWERMDCFIISLLGIGITVSVPVGIIALLALILFSGGLGLIIIFVALSFFMMLMTGIVKAMKIYLNAMITVGVLLIVAPIFIPMMLFSSTKRMFQSWFLLLGSNMMTSMFLVAYLTMMVGVFDALIFKGPYSLWYAIASEASQTENFSMLKWLRDGVDGDGKPVGKNIPGDSAVAIIGYKIACREAGNDKDKLEALSVCDLPLDRMLDCAINPLIPASGQNEHPPENGDCTPLRTSPDYKEYYGFQKNSEILHFAIVTNLESDRDRRIREREKNKKCGLICHFKRGAGKVWNGVKSFVGTVADVYGWLMEKVGSVMKYAGQKIAWVGQKLGNGCRATPMPGFICTTGSGILTVQGKALDIAGSVINLSGRVLADGLSAVFKEMLSNWIDVLTLDFQKVVSYKCSITKKITDPKSELYATDCPGIGDYVKEIIYCLITILIIAYLMKRWMAYIPLLSKELTQASTIASDLPSDMIMARPAKILEERILKSKR